jgi:hypothetical protein
MTTARAETTSAGEFFGELAARGHEAILGSTSGTLRFDLVSGDRVDHWYVTVRKGDVEVSRDDGAADAVVRMGTELFAAVTAGTANLATALLRGEVEPDGDLGLIVSFQRLFPGPPSPRSTP